MTGSTLPSGDRKSSTPTAYSSMTWCSMAEALSMNGRGDAHSDEGASASRGAHGSHSSAHSRNAVAPCISDSRMASRTLRSPYSFAVSFRRGAA